MNLPSQDTDPRTIGPTEPRCNTQVASISVIVPVRNEEPFIERTLGYLLAQDMTDLHVEILVVDGQSDDQTAAIVQRIAENHPQVQLHHNPKRLSSAARNIGIRESTGEYISIVDGHCEITDRQHLQKVVAAFRTSQADCLGRPQPLDVEHASTLQRAIAAARSSWLGHHPESFVYFQEVQFVPAKSVAVAYRRSVFARVGYFDEHFDAHEDGEFNYRCDAAGLRCFFTPDIAVKYYPRNSLSALFRQMVRYGKGRVQLAMKHRGTWIDRTWIPALLVLYIVVGGMFAAFTPATQTAYFTGLCLYAVVVAAFSIATATSLRNVTILPSLPFVFVTIHVGAGIGILLGAILHNTRRPPAAT